MIGSVGIDRISQGYGSWKDWHRQSQRPFSLVVGIYIIAFLATALTQFLFNI
ncbi:MAG: hypothetical protein J7641_19435 [Cyanobacteria bacterium SID2]|nr:hypothetical protein [Cyanobacteria bacterium SID2]